MHEASLHCLINVFIYEKCPFPNCDWNPPLNLYREIIFLDEICQKALILKISENKLLIVWRESEKSTVNGVF